MSDTNAELFTYECTTCGADVRLVGEQRGKWGTPERRTAGFKLACACIAIDAVESPEIPPNWVQNMDYEHPVSA
jgi:hypothetical protein